ncbi:MAG: tannase/feruloyl esterase family alpha/beta hydrolase [Novosphingobium sp.]
MIATTRTAGAALFTLLAVGAAAGLMPGGLTHETPAVSAEPLSALEGQCNAASAQSLAPQGVTVKPIRNGAFSGATRYVAASGATPAYCQVVGSFVTNPASGKTANFMATFPANWNGKYLQLGCSGHCGQFAVSNPAMPTITVTAQGTSKQIIEKGYATFATDEGHEGFDSASWALRKDGTVDDDYVDDFLYRADKVLTRMGKSYTTAFYARVNGSEKAISRSYFNGCSGGGRDAMVAASYFPEEFDGIIAGSPYDSVGMTIQASAIGAAAARSPGGALSPALLALFDQTVKDRCDATDGVKDGLIQNPAACNFDPERDLPRCKSGSAAGQCFTPAQIETLSVVVSGVTDERGNVVQPGYSISELAVEPAAMADLTNGTLKVFVHRNDPAFVPASIYSFRRGGPGAIAGFHAAIPSVEVARIRQAMRLGAGHLPENVATFMGSRTKLLMWHNLSDEKLTPYSSINWYKRLAAGHGGYARVQNRARLFLLPGTGHCSITGIGPNSFDALGAMENWVEGGQAPNSLPASVANRQFMPGAPKAANMATPTYTMPLCMFPQMARYKGTGDVRDAVNWSCNPSDTRLLTIGASGRRAGVTR